MGAEVLKLDSLKPPQSKIRFNQINYQQLIYKMLVLKRYMDLNEENLAEVVLEKLTREDGQDELDADMLETQ